MYVLPYSFIETVLLGNDVGNIIHLTKHTCPAYQNMKLFPHISYIISGRAYRMEFYVANEQMNENFALLYRFPTCMKSKLSSSDSYTSYYC